MLRQWMQQMKNLVHNVSTSVTTQLQNSELRDAKLHFFQRHLISVVTFPENLTFCARKGTGTQRTKFTLTEQKTTIQWLNTSIRLVFMFIPRASWAKHSKITFLLLFELEI
jgi:hypothetical protein